MPHIFAATQRTVRRWAWLMILPLLVVCSGDKGTTIEEPPPLVVTTVAVTPSSASLQVGGTQSLAAAVKDQSGNVMAGQTVSWSTSNSNAATVGTDGMVTATGAGTATITATSSGKSGSSTITVTTTPPPPPVVTTVSVSPTSTSVVAGATTTLTATVKDQNGNAMSGQTVTWSTNNAAAATVSSGGVVTGVAAGSATITATSSGKSGTSAITVTAAPAVVTTVTVSPTSASVAVGATTPLSATVKDAQGNVMTGQTVTWSTSNAAAATVNATGVVTGVAAGTATITATSSGKTGTSAITVTAVPPVVTTVTVAPSSASIAVGGTVALTATVKDQSGNVMTGQTVTWTTSNASYATVSGGGVVTGVAAGPATITATSSGKTGTSSITVTAQSGAAVFSDDFESGTMSKWSESNSAVQKVINDPAQAHSGNFFLRLTYGINGEDAGWLNKYFYQGYTQLYVRYYVRFSANFTGGTKLVGFHGAPIGNPGFGMGRAGICPNGTDSFAGLVVTTFGQGETYPTKMYTYWEDMWADSDGKCWGRYGPTPSTFPYTSPMPEFTKGVWHKVEYAIKMNSSANVADGQEKFWVDGVKYGEWTGIRFGDPSLINIGVLLISGSGTTTQIQTMDYDDLILTTDYPPQSLP